MTQSARDEGQVPVAGSPRSDRSRPTPEADDPCRLIDVYDQAPEGYDGTCLRPLGLCELGGACDACWYNSNREASIKQRPGRDQG